MLLGGPSTRASSRSPRGSLGVSAGATVRKPARPRVSAAGTSWPLYFQRPPTLPLAVAPAFLLLQMGSKSLLRV